MKNLMISLMIVTVTSNTLFATEVCFPKDTAKKIRIDLIKKDFLEVENKSLKTSVTLSMDSLRLRKEQLDIVQGNNNRLAERLRKTNDSTSLYNFLWFGLGVFATGAAVYGAGRLK